MFIQTGIPYIFNVFHAIWFIKKNQYNNKKKYIAVNPNKMVFISTAMSLKIVFE